MLLPNSNGSQELLFLCTHLLCAPEVLKYHCSVAKDFSLASFGLFSLFDSTCLVHKIQNIVLKFQSMDIFWPPYVGDGTLGRVCCVSAKWLLGISLEPHIWDELQLSSSSDILCHCTPGFEFVAEF